MFTNIHIRLLNPQKRSKKSEYETAKGTTDNTMFPSGFQF